MQTRKKKKKNSKFLVSGVLVLLVLALSAGLAFFIQSGKNKPSPSLSENLPNSGTSSKVSTGTPTSQTKEMRAMWISYLEWEKADISTEQAMRTAAGTMFDNSVALGMNTVIVAVRPFGDALYPSQVYPWSHLLTGTQGQDPGYDPLAVLIEEAHNRGLRFEAWINPYRVQGAANGPKTLSENNPAVLHPDWVREASGLWYDPGLPDVQELVTQGVLEIVQNYAIDGIHFDDYFYPEFSPEEREKGLDKTFDETTYLQYGIGKELATWRRENVNTLVEKVYRTVHETKSQVVFGISPQGNNENNYQIQYSDVKHWMANPGYVDYVMPQLYWGFGYRTSSGREEYAFENIAASWAEFPRDESVALYAGLGAYRVGVGDGGANDQSEWESGRNLADMVLHLQQLNGYSGFGLFRYDSLFAADNEFAAQEVQALTQLLQEGKT